VAIAVSPAPSRRGVVIRDTNTRAEVYVELAELVPLSTKLLEEHERQDGIGNRRIR
jgi:hypothetical protein